MKKRRLYVLSVDALVTEDLDFLRQLPAFGAILKDAAISENIISIYPTLTYPIHTTMMTGVYADRHHVYNNEIFTKTEGHLPWFRSCKNFDADVKSVVEAAKQAGYTTAAISWPVTEDMDIDWHLPETWVWDGDNQAMYDAFVKGGAKPEFLDEFWDDYCRGLTGLGEPYFSLAAHGATLAAIRNHQPEVIFEHLSMVDHTRHSNGVFAKQVYRDAYLEAEMMLHETLEAMREVGVLDETTIVITSDHGQTPVNRLVAPNVLLCRDGLLQVDAEGKVSSYQACFMSSAHSAQVFLSEPDNDELKERVYRLLCAYRDSGEAGIAKVFTKEEAKEQYHLDGPFSFVVEGEADCSFSNNVTGELSFRTDNSDYKYSVATHGHLPETGPKPAMVLNGPGIRKNARLDGMPIVDEAPTLAALLGINIGKPDGRAWTELLLEDNT